MVPFFGQVFTDHPWNYEVIYGSRVVPVLAAIGRNLEHLLSIDGFIDRAKRLLDPAKSQPNGGLFEILVAAAYARSGGKVAFRKELPGTGKTHDLDVDLNGKKWAVECKRIESGDYADNERMRMRELWVPASHLLAKAKRSAILNVSFEVELFDIPDEYFPEKALTYIASQRASVSWHDDYTKGIISELDLRPLQDALKKQYWLHPGPQYSKMLTGRYERNDNLLLLHSVKLASNPHYVDEISLAAGARWKSLSETSIEKRARDILKKTRRS